MKTTLKISKADVRHSIPAFYKPSFFYDMDFSKITISKDNKTYNRYCLFKKCLLINDDIVFVFSDNNIDLSDFDNTIQYISLYYDDKDNLYKLKINDMIYKGLTNIKNKNIINESVKINTKLCYIDVYIYEQDPLNRDIIYNAFIPIDGMPLWSDYSNFDLVNLSTINNAYKIDNNNISVEIEMEYSEGIGKISIHYDSDMSKTQLTIINNKQIVEIGFTITIDNIKWICTQVKLDSTGKFTHSFIPEIIFNKLYKYISIDDSNSNEYNNIDEAVKLQKLSVFEDSFLSYYKNEQNYNLLSKVIRDTEIKYDNISSSDIVYHCIKSNNIDTVNYSDLDTIDLSKFGYTIIERDLSKQLINQKIFFNNKFKNKLLDFELNVDVTNSKNDITNNLGFFLFACDGDDKPTNRFTWFYNPSIQYINHSTNITTINNGKLNVADGKLIAVDPAFTKEQSDSMDPFKIVKFISSKPVTHKTHHYIDSLLPNLIPYSQSFVQFTVIKDSFGNYKFIPTTKQRVLYNQDIIDIINNDNQYYWTKTICNFASIKSIDTKEMKNGIKYIDDSISINLNNELTPLSLFVYDKENYITNDFTQLFSKYMENQSKAPFYYNYTISDNSSKLSANGLYYHVKLIHKKQMEMAQQGMMFTMNVPNVKVIIDLENKTSKLLVVYNDKIDEQFIDDDKIKFIEYSNSSGETLSDNYIRYMKVDFSDVTFTYESKTTNLTPLYIDEMIIIPKTDTRLEDHVFLKFGVYIYYFSSYTFASKMFIGIPYATSFDVKPEINNYVITNGETYKSFNKIINPIINDTITLSISQKINDINNILSNITEVFPCKGKMTINNNEKTYFINSIDIDINGNIAKYILKLDDRNSYLDKLYKDKLVFENDKYSLISNEQQNSLKFSNDKSLELPKFELRRRIMNLGIPTEYIYKPPKAVDTYLKDIIHDILDKTYNYDNINISLDIKGKYLLPDGITCTLQDVVNVSNEDTDVGYVCTYDVSGYDFSDKIEFGAEYFNKYVAFNSSFPTKGYIGFSFKPYTLIYDGDNLSDAAIDLSIDNNFLCKFIYPYENDSVSVDLRTDCISYFTMQFDSYQYYKSNKVNARDNAMLTSKSDDIINVKYKICDSEETSFKIKRLTIRPDNPYFIIPPLSNIELYKDTTHITSLDPSNKDKYSTYVEVGQLTVDNQIQEVNDSYNSNNIYVRFKENKNTNEKYLLSINVPFINGNIDRKQQYIILYIKVTNSCKLYYNDDNGNKITHNLPIGECVPIPLCNIATDEITDTSKEWQTPSTIYIDDIRQNTDIAIYGFNIYTNLDNRYKLKSPVKENGQSGA